MPSGWTGPAARRTLLRNGLSLRALDGDLLAYDATPARTGAAALLRRHGTIAATVEVRIEDRDFRSHVVRRAARLGGG